MKSVKLTLYKSLLQKDIDSRTFKRVDATMDQASLRSNNALESDSTEDLDSLLVTRYMDNHDSDLRRHLKFCLVPEEREVLEFDNSIDTDTSYVYNLNVDDSVTTEDLKSVTTKMHEYIINGTLYDWFTHSGVQPTISERGLTDQLDEIAGILRGRSYGRRPLQPFGPAEYEY